MTTESLDAKVKAAFLRKWPHLPADISVVPAILSRFLPGGTFYAIDSHKHVVATLTVTQADLEPAEASPQAM